MLHRAAVMRLFMRDRAGDGGLIRCPFDDLEAGHLPKRRTLPVGGNDQIGRKRPAAAERDRGARPSLSSSAGDCFGRDQRDIGLSSRPLRKAHGAGWRFRR